MSVTEIMTRLDGLAALAAPDVDAGREPDAETMEQYAETLGDFLREYPLDAIAWLREVYSK